MRVVQNYSTMTQTLQSVRSKRAAINRRESMDIKAQGPLLHCCSFKRWISSVLTTHGQSQPQIQSLASFSLLLWHGLPVVRMASGSRAQGWSLRRATMRVLRRVLRVEFHIERPRQLGVPLLLLTARTRGILFQTLQLTRGAFILILTSVLPGARRGRGRRRRRRRPRLWSYMWLRALWLGSTRRKRKGCLIALL
jgi:hypothetical protein